MIQLQDPEGGVDFTHLAVDTGSSNRSLIRESEVFQVVNALLGLCIGADDSASFKGVEHLGGVEAEHGQIAMFEEAFAFIGDTEGVGGIINDFKAVGVGDLLDTFNSARIAIAMNRKDSTGLRSDGFFNAVLVQVTGFGVNVHEYRFDVVPDK